MSDTAVLSGGLPSHIEPGLIIAGKYRLEAEIGRGSMGTVYRALHVTLGQRVAIKLISSEHLQSVEARRRFSVEAKAGAKLRSRHVVQIYDDGETPEGNPYIVLEYLEGETLEQRLDRERDLPLADAVRIVAHVGRALARAHAQGIVHRDLKPANIFLAKTDDDEAGWIAKVLDFGIAKLAGQGEKGTTQAGTVLGTPLFMSPEQVRGASSVDHRADLYSLGMCLFHMLTGEYAYYAPNYSDILVGICTLPLPQLREKAPWVPLAVEQWFQRACAKEPLERFQSADEMTEALQAAAGSAPLSKHKSFPEGRIAPETLVGYAAPALATVQLAPVANAAARTQLVPDAGRPAASAAPVAIAVSAMDSHATATDWKPPRAGVPPLVLGVGLGLAVVALGLAATFLAGSGSPSPTSQSAAAVSKPPSSGNDALSAAPAPAPIIPTASLPPSAVNQSAAPEATTKAEKPGHKPPAPKKSGLLQEAPAKGSPQPAPGKAASSDLGF